MSHNAPSFDIRPCPGSVIEDLCAAHHPYKGSSGAPTYAFAVYEDDLPVAVYAWKPPPYGAAKAVGGSAPWGVLALSRMAAVPRSERILNHVSKPLRHQMRRLIDRGRWPVLITYHDESCGHTGHVYKCSGWHKTTRNKVRTVVDESGRRLSVYSNGKSAALPDNITRGHAWINRWEHHACPPGEELAWMESHGYYREPIPGKVWASGKQAHTVVYRGE